MAPGVVGTFPPRHVAPVPHGPLWVEMNPEKVKVPLLVAVHNALVPKIMFPEAPGPTVNTTEVPD